MELIEMLLGFSFNPLQVQTKLININPLTEVPDSFNPLQVQTKQQTAWQRYQATEKVSIPYRYKQNFKKNYRKKCSCLSFQSPIGTNKTVSSNPFQFDIRQFQSPIGTNKTVNGTTVDSTYQQFQSPIGTNKTWCDVSLLMKHRGVSIPYRYKQNLGALVKRMKEADSFNPLQVQTKPTKQV